MTSPKVKGKSDALVFFGATGDLAYKQIFPALFGLVRDEGLTVPIIGVAKSGWTLDQLKERAKESVAAHGGNTKSESFVQLLSQLRYVDGDYNDPATFQALRKQMGNAKRPLHYLAIPPILFATVTAQLAKSGCADNARLVVEKPFGRDRKSAAELSACIDEYFSEANVFRIDHYLGKEPVQNILYTRFANSMFEPLFNRDYVRSIQITMAENFGVQDRGKFYDETGAIRDVIQNHMLQVLATLTMDPPTGQEHEAMRDSKASLLKAVRALGPKDVVRGQYQGYEKVPGVAAGLHGGDVRRRALRDRQLALGGRADLHPRRQVASRDGRRGDRRVQAAAARDLRRDRVARLRAHALPDSAQRHRGARDPRQDAGRPHGRRGRRAGP